MPLAPFSTPLAAGARRLVDVAMGPLSLTLPKSTSGPESGTSTLLGTSTPTDTHTPDEGALVRFGSGRYFSRGKEVRSSDDSLDEAKQLELWGLSSEAVGIPAGGYLTHT